MAVPQYRDEVLVTLNSRNAPSSLAFPTRKFFLTRENLKIAIGRTSRRNHVYTADTNNAWFDSPVMSREHAYMKLDPNKQKVFVTDIGSLHGTYKNENRLSANVSSHLSSGDVLRFGVPIDRGAEKYSPCTMEATIKFGTADPEERPKVFRVPDDTDMEDSSSDNDGSIRHSLNIIRNAKMRPISVTSSPRHSPIDLTSNDHYPLSNVRGDDDYTSNALPPLLSHVQPVREVAYIDLSSPSPDNCARFSPISTGPETSGFAEEASDAGEEETEEGTHDVNASDMDSIDMHSDPADYPRSRRSSVSNESSDYYAGRALDEEEDEFEEHDEFEDRDDDYEPLSESQEGVKWATDASVTVVKPFSSVDTTSMDEGAEPQCSESANKSHASQFARSFPSVSMTPVELPKLTTTPWTQPYVCPPPTLPSLSEAMYSLHPTSLSPRPETMAEIMGAKTGKFEYFMARDENKKEIASRTDSISGDLGWISLQKAVGEGVLPTVIPQIPHDDSFQPEDTTAGPADVTPSQNKTFQGETSQHEPSQSETLPEISQVEPTEEKLPQDASSQNESSQGEPSQNEPSQNEPSQNEPFQNEPSQNGPSQNGPSQNGPSPIEPSLNELTGTLATSKWAASGTHFLNSPPKEDIEQTQPDGPVLDETSAYQFELSKKATTNSGEATVDSPFQAASAPTEMEICVTPENLREVADQSAASVPTAMEVYVTHENSREVADQSTASPPMKRKAGAISDLTAEEEAKMKVSTRGRRGRKRLRRPQLKEPFEESTNSTVPRMSDAIDDRAPKRLRRVVEVLGFAALGGVAVMSALIATAPTL